MVVVEEEAHCCQVSQLNYYCRIAPREALDSTMTAVLAVVVERSALVAVVAALLAVVLLCGMVWVVLGVAEVAVVVIVVVLVVECFLKALSFRRFQNRQVVGIVDLV